MYGMTQRPRCMTRFPPSPTPKNKKRKRKEKRKCTVQRSQRMDDFVSFDFFVIVILRILEACCVISISVSTGAMWFTMGWVTAQFAEVRLATCSDRGLIEQGKGSGRLQQKVNERLFTPQEPLNSLDDLVNSTQSISHIDRISVVV